VRAFFVLDQFLINWTLAMTPTAESKTHVDAQLSQILELGLELSRRHPARIRRALRLKRCFYP